MESTAIETMVEKLHDINEQLCIGSGYIELLLEPDMDEDQEKKLLIVKNSIKKIGMIVRDAFAAVATHKDNPLNSAKNN
jgi:hypothetical protein